MVSVQQAVAASTSVAISTWNCASKHAFVAIDTLDILRQVSLCVAEVVGTEVATGTPLMVAGIDSLGATEL